MRERRYFHRIPQPIDARYRKSGELDSSWTNAVLVNISAGGLRFRAEELVDAGALIEVQTKVPGMHEVLFVKGMVVWGSLQASGVAEMGVEFSEVDERQQLQIDNLVSFLKSSVPRPPSAAA